MTEANPPLRAAIIPVTPLQQNCSLLWCTATMKASVIDPGGDLPKVRDAIAKTGVTVEKVLLTHGHIDHAGAAIGVEMGEAHPIIARVAASTSAWRISASPIRKQRTPCSAIASRSARVVRPLSATKVQPAGA